MFSNMFTLSVNAEEIIYFYSDSPPYDENVTYYWLDGIITYYYFKVKYIDTPNTTDAILARLSLQEYPESELNAFESEVENNYPNVTLLSSATIMYNCHSYAWYSQDVDTNNYWIDDPSAFYEDHSYCIVSTPQVGDIICYFDNKGTADTSDDLNIHSGIVTAVLSGQSNNVCGTADLVTVTSKWGGYGLYSHNGLDCPYTPYRGGDADYVKYFRSKHNNRLDFLNGEQHLSTCISCNYIQCLSHQYSIVQDPKFESHGLICECGYDKGIREAHYAHHYISKNNTLHYKYCECGYLIGTETHDMYQNGLYNECRDCGKRVNKMTDITIKGVEDELESETE